METTIGVRFSKSGGCKLLEANPQILTGEELQHFINLLSLLSEAVDDIKDKGPLTVLRHANVKVEEHQDARILDVFTSPKGPTLRVGLTVKHTCLKQGLMALQQVIAMAC